MVFIILLAIFLFYCGVMIVRFRRVYMLVKDKKRFPNFYLSEKDPSKHILILGDSSMYGAGVLRVENTIGALFAAKYKDALIEVYAENGARVIDLPTQLNKAQHEEYSLILIGVGANDIMQFSNYKSLQKNLITFLHKAKDISDHIILCHSVNIGNTGFFLFPFNYIFDYRTKKLSEIYFEIATQFPTLTYINFYRNRSNDYYDRATRKKFLATDYAHPNDYANRFFFNIIWKEISKTNMLQYSHLKRT